MKKAILTVLTALMLIIPAYAAEGDTAMDQPIQQEPVVVATLEELQAAIDVAEDGDTIYIADTIPVSNTTIETEKHITIMRIDGFYGAIFRIKGGTTLSGFEFVDNSDDDTSSTLIAIIGAAEEVTVKQCNFYCSSNGIVRFIDISGGFAKTSVKIEHCSFYGATAGAISSKKSTEVLIDSCIFNENRNYLPGGAISSSGVLLVKNTTISNCSAPSGGGIFNSGDLTISNCQFKDNTVENFHYGSDVFSTESLVILDNSSESESYYEESTGDKIILPLTDYKETAKLIYLTEEQAAEYFAPEPPQEEKPTQPEPGNDDGGEDTPSGQPQPPQQPGDQTGDNDTTGEEQPPQKPTQPSETNPDDGEQGQPQEPVQPPKDDPTEQPTEPEQPPEGEGKDDPTENPPEAPEQPVEPPKDDTTDTPTTTPDTPQQPQEPADSNNGNNDNYTPPTDYYPIYRPLWPVVTVKPTEDSKPQTQPDNTPAPAKPQLVCNGAVIDTSRTVVLLGYGDGLIHENDPLTRAQLATIIYRLLDDESIAKYSNAELAFVDVAADAWYAPFVQTINGAGIVQGVGGGKYSPESYVTWSQIVTILTRFVEPQEYPLQHIQYQGWAQEAIQTAVANGWIADRADFTPDAIISRGQLEQLINNVLALYR